MGPQGPRGLEGDIGWSGIDGLPGLDGAKGEQGVTYPFEMALPGDRGEAGLPGFKGEQGDMGEEGEIGLRGYRGLKGLQGDVGEEGPMGPDGIPGEMGMQGPAGFPGRNGLQGAKGERGEHGPPPPPAKSRGYVFARHSQTIQVPECPANTNKLWEGYSIAGNIGSSRAVGQDLGAAGSCLMRFTTMPFMFCDFNNVCNYAQNNDDSMWLSTAEPMSLTMAPIQSRDLMKYISRCVVCETTTKVIALHSQSMSIPDCPNGWEELWTGYSYLMTTTDNSGGFGQNLVSPGSCLLEFRANPVIECHGHGRCNYYDPLASFWLSVIEEHEQWTIPKQATLKADQTSKISRCSVCRRRNSSLINRVSIVSTQTELRRGEERVVSYDPNPRPLNSYNRDYVPNPPTFERDERVLYNTPPPRARRPDLIRNNPRYRPRQRRPPRDA